MTLRCAALALAAVAAAPAPCPAQEKAPPAEHAGRYDDVMARNAWWREARFGMFIHFGAYAVPPAANGQSHERLSVEKFVPMSRPSACSISTPGAGPPSPGPPE
jgi:alpha-L-fucosidase